MPRIRGLLKPAGRTARRTPVNWPEDCLDAVVGTGFSAILVLAAVAVENAMDGKGTLA
jgi:hypothetical protein